MDKKNNYNKFFRNQCMTTTTRCLLLRTNDLLEKE